MTGVSELRTMQLVSAAPEQLRVSVLGGRTQLDVALPADVPVAGFLPELVQLIRSRDTRRDDEVPDRDERRTFWVLTRIDNGKVLAPNETLRAAGVSNGQLLRISARRALSPPMLHDDVVDAAARLNRAAYAAWNPTAAKVMAFTGLWLGTAVWVAFLLTDQLSAHRVAMVIGAALTTVTLIAGAAVVQRVLALSDVATAAGWAGLALSATLAAALATPYGAMGFAIAGACLLALTGVYYRVIGTGHLAYIAAAVMFAVCGLAMLGLALGGKVEVVTTVATTIAALACVAMPALTANLARFRSSKAKKDGADLGQGRNDPFTSSTVAFSGADIPSAEQVWARVHAIELGRAGVLAGLAGVVVFGAVALLDARTELSAFVFALTSAAVLALLSRKKGTWPERAALAAPALVLTVIACVFSQDGAMPVRFAGIAVLGTVAILTTLAGLVVVRRPWVSTTAAYLEYVTVAALVPLALWPLGFFERLGL